MLTSQFNFTELFKAAELWHVSTHLLEADENAKPLQYTNYASLVRDGWRNLFIRIIF